MRLEEKRDSLIVDNLFVDTVRSTDTVPNNQTSISGPNIDMPDFVVPSFSKSVYYEFKIEAFGWYNVDIFMKDIPGFADSELMVSIQGEYEASLGVYLVIPSYRINVPGGLLDGKEDEYGFYTPYGKIPLPQNAEAYILAMTEINGTIRYDSKAFYTRESQRFEMTLKEVSPEEFNKSIRSLGLGGMTLTVRDSKNANQIRDTDRQIDSIKPKNCECICAELEERYRQSAAREDSTAPAAFEYRN